MIRLEHVGIAVHSMDDLLARVSDLLGRQPYKTERVPHEGVSTHFVAAGDAKVEFVESVEDSSAIARFLAKKGEGIHHLAFEVEDIELWRARVIEAGMRVIGESAARGADGKLVFFVHPKDTFGVLFEFCQTVRPIWNSATVVQLGWKCYFCGSPDSPTIIFLVDQDRKNELAEIVARLEAHANIEVLPVPDDDLTPDTASKVLRYLRSQHSDRRFHLMGLGVGVFLAMDIAKEAQEQAGRLALDVGALPAHFYTRVVEQAHDLKHPTLLLAGDHTMIHAGELLSQTKSDWVSLAVMPNADAALGDGNTDVYATLLRDHLLG